MTEQQQIGKGRSKTLRESSFYSDESQVYVKLYYVKEIREVINFIKFGPELLLHQLELEVNYKSQWFLSKFKNLKSTSFCKCVGVSIYVWYGRKERQRNQSTFSLSL